MRGLEYIDRSKLVSIQSPEAYNFGVLHQTFLQAKKIQHDFQETCCAMVMYNMGRKIAFVEGNRYNMKIVRQEDINLVEALLTTEKYS